MVAQVVIATHTDKAHIHSHLIVNTYTLDGKKINDNQTTLKQVRNSSDEVCLQYGFMPIEKKNSKGQSAKYNEWLHEKQGTSWKEKVRQDIDGLILQVKSFDELIEKLKSLGYEVKLGKYISLRAEGQERFVRTKTLGYDYTEDSLKARIDYKIDISSKPVEELLNDLQKTYYRTIYKVSEMVESGKKSPNKHNPSLPYSAENDDYIHKLSFQLSIINRDGIQSIKHLERLLADNTKTLEDTKRAINQLATEQSTLADALQSVKLYNELVSKSSLTQAERLKLSMCKEYIKKYNLTNTDEVNRLKGLFNQNESRIATLKQQLAQREQTYKIYQDISKTYNQITKQDYISNLDKNINSKLTF
jgi:hypothetical protein